MSSCRIESLNTPLQVKKDLSKFQFLRYPRTIAVRDLNETDTCRTYIIPKFESADWENETITERLVLTPGRIVPIGDKHTPREVLHPDYTLIIRQNIPMTVIEAGKRCDLAKCLVSCWQI